jgi:hypothetical protein
MNQPKTKQKTVIISPSERDGDLNQGDICGVESKCVPWKCMWTGYVRDLTLCSSHCALNLQVGHA